MRLYYIFGIWTLLLVAGFACENDSKLKKVKYTEQEISSSEDIHPEKLARQRCGSCHAYPEPDLLNYASWKKYILPRMGAMMGFYSDSMERVELAGGLKNLKLIQKSGLYPPKPVMSLEEWKKIQDFYLARAPVELSQKHIVPDSHQTQFELEVPAFKLSPPSTTFIGFFDQEIVLGDAHSKKLYFLDNQDRVTKAARTGESVVQLHEDSSNWYATVIGSFSPNDLPGGYLLKLPKEAGKAEKVVSGLRRPVDSEFGDFDNDDKADVAISEFGKWAGGLSIYFDYGEEKKKVQLANTTGCLQLESLDIDKDGDLDIIALFGQGNERISLFENLGQRNFREKVLIQFSPSNGSSYFKLTDFNNDKRPDLLYTAGDNADFKPIIKPYHGIYGFLNQGGFEFEQEFFYPMPGAYQAILEDFDKDGVKEIAAISFFPDFKNGASQSFVYLEHEGDWQFSAFKLNDPLQGRFITMTSADLENDGDTDLILGSLAFETVTDLNLVSKWQQESIPYLILRNNQISTIPLEL